MITNRKDMINDLSKYMNSRKGNKRDLVNIGVIVPISRLQNKALPGFSFIQSITYKRSTVLYQ